MNPAHTTFKCLLSKTLVLCQDQYVTRDFGIGELVTFGYLSSALANLVCNYHCNILEETGQKLIFS